MPVNTISLNDLVRLKKLMGMTTSNSDGEALTALRMANKILQSSKITWQDIFDRTVAAQPEMAEEAEDERPTSTSQTVDIDEAFEIIREGGLRPGGFADFIDSLEEQWRRKKWLSEAQRAALFKSVARTRQYANGRR